MAEKSTESPQIETACFRPVLPETADNQNEAKMQGDENIEENGGRGKDRTCDHSRVKGAQSVEITAQSQKSTDSPLETLVRRLIETGKDDADRVIRSRIAIIKKQTRELERDPDRPGLAATRLSHIRALDAYRAQRAG